MPLSTETIQNTPLTGVELMEFILFRLREAMEKDWVFSANGITHPRVAFSVEVVCHFANPNLKPHRTRARVERKGAVEGEPPLENATDGGVHAFVVDEPPVDNPNLARVGAGIPIMTRTVKRPGPGELFGEVQTHQVRYEKEDYPELPAGRIKRTSGAKAKELGVVGYSLEDPEDVEAIGVEEGAEGN